jgi:hypothetical protein
MSSDQHGEFWSWCNSFFRDYTTVKSVDVYDVHIRIIILFIIINYIACDVKRLYRLINRENRQQKGSTPEMFVDMI